MTYLPVAVLVLSVPLLSVLALAQQPPGGAAPHVAAAKKAAGQEHAFLFENLCVPPPPGPPRAAADDAPAPPRDQRYAPPAKVFDNFYFVGERMYTAWAVTTSDGIIVIDPLFEYSVEDEIINGLKTLGLDPTRVRYVLVSHAHHDHVGGAALLQQRLGARVIMSADDWELLAAEPGRWPKPRKDIVATDGYKLTLGDTTLLLYLTPGHTLGTISTIIPLRDGSRTHVGALWGGTLFNWRSGHISAARPPAFWYDHYARSARRFREIAAKAGADVLLSNHPEWDASATKLTRLAARPRRTAGQSHPYVVGNESVSRFLTVAEECARAGPRW
jgi:metallo-beta-lactamase class B